MPDQDWRKWLAQGGYAPPGSGVLAPGQTASNVPAPEQMSTPVRPAGGDLVPAPDTSGLYAIYGRRNPYASKAERLTRMAGMDMGGRLGQLPGVVAAFMGRREEAKSEAFEADRNEEIKKFLARKEAYDEIKNNREARQSNAKYLSESVFPAAQQEYARVLQESKDLQAASKAASQVANKMASDAGIPAPEVVAFNAWKGASSMSVINENGEKSTAIYKDGAFLVQNKKGDFEPPTEKWLNIKDVADLLDSESRQQRAATGGLKGKEHGYLTASGELLFSTDPDDAMKKGAVKVMRETRDEEGVMSTREFWLPGKAPKGGEEPPAQPQAQAPEQPSMLGRAARVVGNALSGGGGVARAAAQMGGPVPGGQQAPAQQSQLIRRASNGRIALFDPNTKAFVRWE